MVSVLGIVTMVWGYILHLWVLGPLGEARSDAPPCGLLLPAVRGGDAAIIVPAYAEDDSSSGLVEKQEIHMMG